MPAVPTRSPSPAAPPVGPNPPHRRLWLGLKLLVVPVAVVCLPSLFVTYFFGQRPAPKTPPDAALAGLRESLERAARTRLPEAATTFGARFEDLALPCPAAEADGRLEALRGFAARCGGIVTDQATDAAGRHLLVDLPGGNLRRFRREVVGPLEPPAPDPSPAGPEDGGRVFLRVTLTPPPGSPAP